MPPRRGSGHLSLGIQDGEPLEEENGERDRRAGGIELEASGIQERQIGKHRVGSPAWIYRGVVMGRGAPEGAACTLKAGADTR